MIVVFLDKSGVYVFKSAQYICQFTSLDFHIIPCGFHCLTGGFPYLSGRKFTFRSHPRTFFENLTFSLVSQAVLTRVLRQVVLLLKVFGHLNLWQTHLLLKIEKYKSYVLLASHPKILVSNPTLIVVSLWHWSTRSTYLLIWQI